VDCIGVVLTFKRSLKRPARLIDLGIARIHIFIGGSQGYVIVPVILNSGSEPDLPVQG
jgi:hypothetical protein